MTYSETLGLIFVGTEKHYILSFSIAELFSNNPPQSLTEKKIIESIDKFEESKDLDDID